MFYSCFFVTFYQNTSKFGFWVDGWVLVIRTQALQGFSWNFLSRQQLVRQLVNSLSGYNNLVPLHLWWRQIVLKSEKVSTCFVQDCIASYKSAYLLEMVNTEVTVTLWRYLVSNCCVTIFINVYKCL